MTKQASIRVFLILALLGSAGSGGWYWWRTHRVKPTGDELILHGNIDVRQVELAINGSERIERLFVEEGDSITNGQLLAELETERLQFAVARAKAQIETQRQVVARLEAGSREEEIRKAKADVVAAQATARDAKRTWNRYQAAFKKMAVNQQELDDAQAAHETADAHVKAAEAARDLVIAGPRKEDIAQAKALLKRYEAELAQVEHDLKDAHLYAPSDGVVQSRTLEVGDMASPLKPVYTVALTNPVWVRVYVTEPDLGKIREGTKAIVVTDSFPDKEYEGWIGFISPTAEFTPKPVETTELRTKLVYQVRVFVKNPNHELRLGMPATVKIRLDQPKPKMKSKTKNRTSSATQKSKTSL